MSKVATKRPSVFDTIVEKGEENAALLEETFTGPIVELATSYIRPNPNNPRRRIPQSSIDDMANAIRQVGEILQPLLVRPIAHDEQGHRYEIVCGDRRLLGARQENLSKVPVRVRELTDEEATRFALWENLARKDLDAMDVADSVDRLRHIDRLTWPELATRFGVSKQWVWKLQKMAELPEIVKDMVRDRSLSAYNATLLTQLAATDENVIAFAQEIIDRKLSTREVERLLDERRGDRALVDRKGAFTVTWTPPPGYQGRRYSRIVRAADDIVASLRDGKITPELARSLQPVAQALIEAGSIQQEDPPLDGAGGHHKNRQKIETADGPG